MHATLPPGPLGTWIPTLKIIRNPRQAFCTWVQKYGDPFIVRALNGPIVVTGRSDLIKQVFAEDSQTFVPFAVDTLLPLFGAGSMLLMSGEPHRRERRLIMPMFHSDRMRAYSQVMCQVADELFSHKKLAQPLTILPLMNEISLRIIARTIFGGELNERLSMLIEQGRRLVRTSNPVLFFSKKTHVSFFGLSPWDRFHRAKQDLYASFDQEIQRRRTAPSERGDILSLLMSARYEDGREMEREHIYDELGTFLFAGHETSALAMTWAMYHLHQHPESLAKLRAELDTVGPDQPALLAQLPYLKGVVQETLRLNPIVTEVLRLLARPLQLGEYTLPAGVAVAPCSALAHYNPTVFPEPDQFRPERFIERTYSPFEYMPFGGGHRRCIGAAFATFEMAIVLGTILQRYEFELLEPRPVVAKRRNIVLGPSSAVRMQLARRRIS